jgi:hypothetical protein
VPEVCIEIVSNREGDELTLSRKSQQKGKTASKKEIYAQIGVPYYAVFDPLEQLQQEMNGAQLQVWALREGRYQALQPPFQLATVGLELTVWDGRFEGVDGQWLRWCSLDGQVIPTGAEGRELERQRAEAERQRADRLAKRLRAMGINPDDI